MKIGLPFWVVGILALGCNGGESKTNDEDTEPLIGILFTLLSPDERVRVTLNLIDLEGEADYPAGKRLYYTVALGDGDEYQKIIAYSPLGIVRDDADFADGLVVQAVSGETEIDETYEMLTGKRSTCRNHANERSVTVANSDGDLLQIIFRAYNDGAAFRYVFPDEDEEVHTVTEELSGFRIPDRSLAWLLPYDAPAHDKPAYEGYWQDAVQVGTVASEVIEYSGTAPGEASVLGWSLPALFKTEDEQWILLAETDVTETYCGARLSDNAPSNVYRIGFPGPGEAQEIGEAKPSWTLPWTMPWRIIVVGDSLAPIVETTLPTDLATPSVLDDESWIAPGRAAWHWWSYEGMDFDVLTTFVDLAAEMTWEYNLVDAEWDSMENGTWLDMQAYAEEAGVSLFLWYNGGGDHNTWAYGPRDMMSDPEVRRSELEKISEAGIKGVKVDFFQSDKQWMMAYYLDILKDAADFEILVNFHGSTIPRGWQRTYPNLMTSEAVRGAEFYKWDAQYAREQPWLNTILPFTRNTVASMDFTPVTFTDNNQAHATTYGHELALSVVFESGVFHFADAVEGYTSLPEGPKSFLQQVPTTWDDTRFIDGEPGKWIVLARRKGNDWYAAGISGDDEEREVALALTFLDQGDYEMSLNADGESDNTFAESTETVTADQTVYIMMRANGGFAAVFKAR